MPQDDLQMQPANQPSGVPPQIVGNEADIVAQLLDTSFLLSLVKERLLGKEWNPLTKTFEEVGKPLLPEKAVNELIGLLATHIGHVTVTSNLTEKQISNILLDVSEMLVMYLVEIWVYQGYIDGSSKASLIFNMIMDTLEASLHRAKGGFTANLIKGITERKIVEQHTYNEKVP